MGDFKGHAGPGSFFLLIGIVIFLRSLNLTTRYNIPRSKDSRKSPFKSASVVPLFPILRGKHMILFDAVGTFIAGATMFTGEGLDVLMSGSRSSSHKDHLRIDFLIAATGLIMLLHHLKILKHIGWCLFGPFGLAFVGILFNSHHQETLLKGFAHNINTYFLIGAGIAKTATLMVGLHTNRAYHEKVERLEQLSQLQSSKNGSFPNSGVRSDIVIGVHSMYTNPVIFATVLPFAEACFITANGIWWWMMALRFYIFKLPKEMEEGHHGMSQAYKMLYYTFFCLIILFSLLSFVSRKIVAWRNKDYYEEFTKIQVVDIENNIQEESSVEMDRLL